MRAPRLARPFAIVAVLLLLTAGCGGDDDDDASAADANEVDADDGDDAADDGDGDTAASDDDDDAESGSVPSDIPDGNWVTGSAHVETSGDKDLSVDLTEGGGSATGGFMSLSFGGDDYLLGVVVDPKGTGGGISFTNNSGAFGTGGAVPACQISITQADASGVAGSFRCDDADAVDGADAMKLDVEGTFSVSA